MKKNKYQILDNELVEDIKPSRSQKKREATALQEQGDSLVKLSKEKLLEQNLSEELFSAVLEYKRLSTHESKRRQMQYIGKLLRI